VRGSSRPQSMAPVRIRPKNPRRRCWCNLSRSEFHRSPSESHGTTPAKLRPLCGVQERDDPETPIESAGRRWPPSFQCRRDQLLTCSCFIATAAPAYWRRPRRPKRAPAPGCIGAVITTARASEARGVLRVTRARWCRAKQGVPTCADRKRFSRCRLHLRPATSRAGARRSARRADIRARSTPHFFRAAHRPRRMPEPQRATGSGPPHFPPNVESHKRSDAGPPAITPPLRGDEPRSARAVRPLRPGSTISMRPRTGSLRKLTKDWPTG